LEEELAWSLEEEEELGAWSLEEEELELELQEGAGPR